MHKVMFDNRQEEYYIRDLYPIHTFSLDNPKVYLIPSEMPDSTESLPLLSPYSASPTLIQHPALSTQYFPQLRCVIGTHLAPGADFSTITPEVRTMLSYMCPFYNVPLTSTEEIIFGRRLIDVHILIKEEHVSAQQFFLKFQPHPHRLSIQNHGNQVIRINSMSGPMKQSLDRNQKYEFEHDDDVWLIILGIDKVFWRITVNCVIQEIERVPVITFENNYFNRDMYLTTMQKQGSRPLALPGDVNIMPFEIKYN